MLADIYEPGSVMKVLTLAGAIDQGKITPATTISDPGYVDVGGVRLRDWDQRSHGTVTMTNVLESSLNVGAVKAQQMEGQDAFLHYLDAFGIGRGSELRKLVCDGYVAATCAAFSPEAKDGFIVAGTRKGNVHIWPMPTEQDFVQVGDGHAHNVHQDLDAGGDRSLSELQLAYVTLAEVDVLGEEEGTHPIDRDQPV